MSCTQIADRDLILDFVKGILVIIMVIYHIMNYFTTASDTTFTYVRFITGSFVFISGYIIAVYYEHRFNIDKHTTSRRLITRGGKLLLLFTFLNIIINITEVGNPNKALGLSRYVHDFVDIYIYGTPYRASFQVLLPISYLLALSPIFLLFSCLYLYAYAVLFLLVFFLALLATPSVNVNLIIIGLIGLSVGMMSNSLKYPFFLTRTWIIVPLIAICVSLMGYLDKYIIAYSMGIIIILKLFYDLGRSSNLQTHLNQLIILLGQYTLVCYIMQIVFLQGLVFLLSRRRWGLGYETISIFLITIIFLSVLSLSIRFLRDRYTFMDKVYRLVFA